MRNVGQRTRMSAVQPIDSDRKFEELTVPCSIIYLFIIYDVLFYGFAEMFYLKESCEITHLIFAPV